MRRLGFLLAFCVLLGLAWLARSSAPGVPGDAADGAASTTDTAGLGLGAGTERLAAAAELLEARLLADPRLAAALGDCARREAYDGDTSDAVAILVRKLAGTSSEPLNRARAELAALGAEALPELRRFVEKSFDDPLHPAWVQNGLETLAAMDEPLGRGLLRRGLGHPSEAARRAAVLGLVRHASPYEYDALYDLLGRERPELRDEIVVALATADRERLVRDVLGWFEAGENEELWPYAAPFVCAADDAQVVERVRATWRARPLALQPFLAACLAAAGEQEALEALRGWLVDENPTTRLGAARGLECAGLATELVPLADDADASLRLFALEALASSTAEDAPTTGLLRQALGDPVAGVRNAALAALVARGDRGAEDRALEALRGDAQELEAGLAALQRAWDARPELAERALAILKAERELRAHRGSGELASIEQAIGRVPLAEGTRFLCDLAHAAPLGARGARAELRDHRWYVLKAGNARDVARPVLIERWQRELDPQRRMDFVEAIAFARGAEVVDFLLRALEREDLHACEVLHLALCAVRQQATARTAPALKRATLGVAHARVRPALNCLLWEWY